MPVFTSDELERHRVTDPGILAQIERLYVEEYYRPEDSEFLKTEAGKRDIRANVTTRYEQSLFKLIPWIQRVFDLRGKDVLEIGCGTGSSTAALARFAARVYTCDIKERNLPVAEGRMALLALGNVRIVLEGAPQIFLRARGEFAPQVDAVVLAAVIEHQTVPERVETLREAWSILRDGGVLIVYETPNRLTYMDLHTADLPFHHMLGEEIAVRYAHNSPRQSFRVPMLTVRDKDPLAARLFLVRHGIGASFHEFELGLPTDGVTILADGYEKEMTDLWGINYEERLLQSFMHQRGLGVHPAFMRHTLCVIFQKTPGVQGWASATPQRPLSPLLATRGDLELIAAHLARNDTPAAARKVEALLGKPITPSPPSPGAPPARRSPLRAGLSSLVRRLRAGAARVGGPDA